MKLNTVTNLETELLNSKRVDFSIVKNSLSLLIQELSEQTASFEKGKVNFNQELKSNLKLYTDKISEDIANTNASIDWVYNQISELTELEQKLAARDLVDIQEILYGVDSQMKSIINSLELDLRLSYFWKFWLTKVAPLEKELKTKFKKFNLIS